jgi:hypothetical protein
MYTGIIYLHKQKLSLVIRYKSSYFKEAKLAGMKPGLKLQRNKTVISHYLLATVVDKLLL